MIFICLGTQKFQCNRLLKEVDRLVEQGLIQEKVFAQRGHSEYVPTQYESVELLDRDNFEKRIAQCSMIISHSGVGTIISAINYHKPIIVFPRLKKYKEHVDDHQLDIARAFHKKHLVLMYNEGDNLSELIKRGKNFQFESYTSQREKVIELIKIYLREGIGNV